MQKNMQIKWFTDIVIVNEHSKYETRGSYSSARSGDQFP